MRAETAHLKGHTALVTSIAFSEDKKTMISCAKDGKIGFWNAKDNFKQLSLFKYSKTEDELNVVHFLVSDAPYVIVGGASGALSIFDINHNRVCFQQSDFSRNELTKIFPLHKSPNQILALNADQQLTLYSIVPNLGKKGGIALQQIEQKCLYLDEIIDVRILQEEGELPQKAVLCSNNELLKVVDLESGTVVQASGGHQDIILCVDRHQKWIVSGSKDNSLRLWRYSEEEGLKCVAVFSGHNENVASVCFGPKKGNFIVSASQDNTIKVWDISKLKDAED